jgi:hypothetical protein
VICLRYKTWFQPSWCKKLDFVTSHFNHDTISSESDGLHEHAEIFLKQLGNITAHSLFAFPVIDDAEEYDQENDIECKLHLPAYEQRAELIKGS